MARIALQPQPGKTIYYRRDLRRRVTGPEATTDYGADVDDPQRAQSA